jgi:hypothetical protein
MWVYSSVELPQVMIGFNATPAVMQFATLKSQVAEGLRGARGFFTGATGEAAGGAAADFVEGAGEDLAAGLAADFAAVLAAGFEAVGFALPAPSALAPPTLPAADVTDANSLGLLVLEGFFGARASDSASLRAISQWRASWPWGRPSVSQIWCASSLIRFSSALISTLPDITQFE